MAKLKTIYVCQSCASTYLKWQGRCGNCGEWNTIVEEVEIDKKETLNDAFISGNVLIESLDNYSSLELIRMELPDSEINRIIGGGLVQGSVVLIGGEPGIGKSTLLLQLALGFKDKKVVYVSGEESIGQIKLRAKRLGLVNKNCHLLAETNLELIMRTFEMLVPEFIIIDSIQTLHTAQIDNSAGSVSQIRECASALIHYAKQKNVPVFLVGHITKEGYIAGPKILEHMVDTVMYFEGDRNYDYRLLRTIKNRFGSVSDIGIYEMHENGLMEVKNPSDILLAHRDLDLSGIAVAASVEGIRPMLIEVQALVSPTYYGTPQRNATGFESRRLSMLLAVIEKRCGIKINAQDIFINIAGGIKPEDPSIDMGVISALISSYYDNPIKGNFCFAGEVGLSGEIRAVSQLDKRIMEAEKLGFEKIFVSSYNKSNTNKYKSIGISKVSSVKELISQLFK